MRQCSTPSPRLIKFVDFDVILDIFSQTDESLFNLNLTLGICIFSIVYAKFN